MSITNLINCYDFHSFWGFVICFLGYLDTKTHLNNLDRLLVKVLAVVPVLSMGRGYIIEAG